MRLNYIFMAAALILTSCKTIEKTSRASSQERTIKQDLGFLGVGRFEKDSTVVNGDTVFRFKTIQIEKYFYKTLYIDSSKVDTIYIAEKGGKKEPSTWEKSPIFTLGLLIGVVIMVIISVKRSN